MAILEINGTEYEAKCNFKFDRIADEKYNEEDAKGNKTGGFMNIYMNLLNYSNKHLVAFWDCGLAHLKGKERPSVEAIEDALEARIEADGDTEALFSEAFKAIDESGFYRKQAANFWKNIEAMKEMGDTPEKKEANLKAYTQLQEAKTALLA